MRQFPENFMWGAATSSYQVEGGNSHADWWAWEKKNNKVNSGIACEHINRYEQDFDIIKELHHNAHRLSIEWSRVEPREGEFSHEAIAHYVKVIKALRERGIEPMVTLHHFTNPQWLSLTGGWENPRVVEKFLRFSETMVKALSSQVKIWITINEPTIYITHSFMWGFWPPQGKSLWRGLKVRSHMIHAHRQAYALINRIYQEQHLPKPAISIAQHVSAYMPCEPTRRNRAAVMLRDKIGNFDILDVLIKHQTLDFIGLNYYSRQQVDVTSWWIGNLLMETCRHQHHPVSKNSLGWDIYPEGLYVVLKKLHQRYQMPVIITENGVCTDDDTQRWHFIKEHLTSVHRAISEGVRVQGYLYWSLLDNFEWDKGFAPRFGLVEMDYVTQQRRIRESARKFAQVCAKGILEG